MRVQTALGVKTIREIPKSEKRAIIITETRYTLADDPSSHLQRRIISSSHRQVNPCFRDANVFF